MTPGARTIEVLPDSVANQIAAGEVVERPASVVKELVENALDAGARRVEVRIEGGGKRSIRVSDDGRGMGREDCLLSLDRHATSKIRQAGDLQGVRTFGFRGEALPSIAAVSRMAIESADGSPEGGTSVRVEGGRITDVRDVARRRGTTVEVRSLFFNAPARRKFLKGVPAETRAVSDAVTSLALANPGVAFHLVSEGRSLMELPPAGDLGERVGQLWGREEREALLEVMGERAGMRVRGLVQRPDAARPGFRRVHLFIGTRPFREGALVRAADRGYRTTVPDAARPWILLTLEVPAGSVDVNVHPAKAEVRFRDPAAVEALVEESVRAALAELASAAPLGRDASDSSGAGALVRERPPDAQGASTAPAAQMALFLSGDGPEPGDPGASAPESVVEPLEAPRLWQVHRTWILAETRDGLLLIDQHSAHERVLFQELMDAFAAGGQTGQRLLFPLTLRLSSGEYREVEALLGLLARAGFEVEGFGGDTVIVHSVPNPHPWFDAERCFREMVSELTQGSELVRSARNQHERIAKTFACKGAIKAGQRLSEAEMEELFDRLFATELPYHDVHGRPTVVRLTTRELERRFGRE